MTSTPESTAAIKILERRLDRAHAERDDLAERLERVQAVADTPPLVHDGQPMVRLDALRAVLADTGGEDR